MKKFVLKDAPKGDGWTVARRRAWVDGANAALRAGLSREEIIGSGQLRARAMKEKPDEDDAEAADESKTSTACDDDDEEQKRSRARTQTALEMQTRSLALNGVPKSFDAAARTVEAVVSIGTAVTRYDWWTDTKYLEVLDMKPGSIRLERLNGGAQLLNGHDTWGGLGAILGAVVPGSARVENGELRCRFQLSKNNEDSVRVGQDLADGIPFLLSTGYKTHQERIDGTTNPPTHTAIDWEPLEVSIVPVSAEGAATGFRSLPHTRRGGDTMPTEEEIRAKIEAENKRKAEEAAATAAAAAETERKRKEDLDRAAAAERARATEIMETCRSAGLTQEFAEDLVKRGVAMDEARKEIIAKVAEDQKRRLQQTNGSQQQGDPLSGRFDPVSGRVIREASEGEADAIVDSIVTRILASRRDAPGIVSQTQREWCETRGVVDRVALARRVYDGHEKPVNERSKQFYGMSLVEIAAQRIGWKRQILPGNVHEIFTRAFNSTGDFPAILENALHKSLLARYGLAMPTYRMLAIQRNFMDFRAHNQVRAGEFPTLAELTETGEIPAGSSVDSKETVSVKPYGRQYGLSRQTLVNDDMGGIDQILSSISDVVTIFENNTFFTMFNSNPVLLQDTVAVFDANTHKNYTTPGGNPGISSVSTGRKALRKMKSLSSNILNVTARIIFAGPNQETAIDQLVTSIQPVVVGAVNPFSGKLTPANDANITGDEWYLFADPSQIPCFVYGFLNGATGPRVRTDEPFGYQGIKFSVEHDFGCGAIDFRGCYKDAGVGPSGG
jgi:hypothetical protein